MSALSQAYPSIIVVPEVETRSQWYRDTMAARAADEAKGIRLRVVNATVKAPILAPKKIGKMAKSQRVVRTKFCSECGKQLNATNNSGLCNIHLKKRDYLARKGPRPACRQCGKKINRKNALGLCETHAGPAYRNGARTKRRVKAREERKAQCSQ